jgi:hypothetical protein
MMSHYPPKLLCLALLLFGAGAARSEEKSTSLPDARAAVEKNLSTPEGKKFDEQLGSDFVSKHLGPLRQCKQTADDDLRSFWILIKLNPDGTAGEVLLYPETKLGICARETLLKGQVSASAATSVLGQRVYEAGAVMSSSFVPCRSSSGRFPP